MSYFHKSFSDLRILVESLLLKDVCAIRFNYRNGRARDLPVQRPRFGNDQRRTVCRLCAWRRQHPVYQPPRPSASPFLRDQHSCFFRRALLAQGKGHLGAISRRAPCDASVRDCHALNSQYILTQCLFFYRTGRRSLSISPARPSRRATLSLWCCTP